MCMYMHACHRHICGSQRPTCRELLLFFHHVGPEGRTQISQSCGKCLYLLVILIELFFHCLRDGLVVLALAGLAFDM